VFYRRNGYKTIWFKVRSHIFKQLF